MNRIGKYDFNELHLGDYSVSTLSVGIFKWVKGTTVPVKRTGAIIRVWGSDPKEINQAAKVLCEDLNRKSEIAFELVKRFKKVRTDRVFLAIGKP